MSIVFSVVVCASLTAIDGDSIRCDGKEMRLLGAGAPNVSGVDSPELQGKCRAERMLAKLAKDRLEELIQQKGVKVEDSGHVDPSFKHPLVRVRLPDGRFAGEVLIEEGYAVEWKPDYTPDWCVQQ